jgi:hypothetical protein
MNTQDFFEEVSNMIKAIGTSSSANEERDERSVENYVRGNSNTNTTNSQTGGNTIMSNTTEPDPKGDIAVAKSFPTAGGDHLISQETRPTDGATSVSDAPNSESVVPNEATIPSSATSAVSPSRQGEMQNATEESIAKAATCKECGQALPVAKADEPKDADEITKAENCADCGKAMNLCNCMGKAVDEKETAAEAAKETPADEKAEMKKSLWGGAFAPVK